MPAPYNYRSLCWVRSQSTSVTLYRIDQKPSGGAFSAIGYVQAATGAWLYRFLTGVLDDLETYTWRIVPLDSAGNAAASPTEIGPEKIVRTPDTVDFSVAFDNDTQKVTFSEA